MGFASGCGDCNFNFSFSRTTFRFLPKDGDSSAQRAISVSLSRYSSAVCLISSSKRPFFQIDCQVKCNTIREKFLKHLEGSQKIKTFARTIVDEINKTLPWRIRIAEKYFHSCNLSQSFMCSKFFPVIDSKTFFQLFRNGRKGFDRGVIESIVLSVIYFECNKIS